MSACLTTVCHFNVSSPLIIAIILINKVWMETQNCLQGDFLSREDTQTHTQSYAIQYNSRAIKH